MSDVHVRVRAGGEHYALPVEGVREITRRDPITPVPGAPAAVLGVWNLRGDVVAAIDLAAMLGLAPGDGEGRIVVVEEGRLHAGLAVEEVLEVEALPTTLEPTGSPFLAGATLVDGVQVGVVDLSALLAAAREGG
ncbi:MAG TPA: chemotaxis protein CheW [Solirubrobacterales bacterium]|nr:chemotaxis protein CheW [Solirubrobacterales bacterium]